MTKNDVANNALFRQENIGNLKQSKAI